MSLSRETFLHSTVSGGPFTIVATNLAYPNCSDTGLTSGIVYYYVVTATNPYGESANSVEASARAVSSTSPQLDFVTGGGQMQLSWPLDHLGWHLETQTNSLNAGPGTNWVVVANSDKTNRVFITILPANGSAFFRLVYP